MGKDFNKPKAVVVGLDFSGLGLARSLSRSGVNVTAVVIDSNDRGVWTRFGKKVRCTSTGINAVTDCLESIAKGFNGSKAALFLTSDDQVREVSENRERLYGNYSFNLPDRGVLETLMDKGLFADYAAARKLPVPETFFIKNADDTARVAERIKYPCILKPVYKTREWVRRSVPKAFKVMGPEESHTGL